MLPRPSPAASPSPWSVITDRYLDVCTGDRPTLRGRAWKLVLVSTSGYTWEATYSAWSFRAGFRAYPPLDIAIEDHRSALVLAVERWRGRAPDTAVDALLALLRGLAC